MYTANNEINYYIALTPCSIKIILRNCDIITSKCSNTCSQWLTEDLILNEIKMYQGRIEDWVVAFLSSKNLM